MIETLWGTGKIRWLRDTDSIIHPDDGKNSVKTGDLSREWTDESSRGAHIVKFVATGPKSYYLTSSGKEVTKIKGSTISHKHANKLNGETLGKLIEGHTQEIKITDRLITRKK